jgi:hypothetical protein
LLSAHSPPALLGGRDIVAGSGKPPEDALLAGRGREIHERTEVQADTVIFLDGRVAQTATMMPEEDLSADLSQVEPEQAEAPWKRRTS